MHHEPDVMAKAPTYFLPHQRFDDLLQQLQQAGFRCIGPQVRDGTIVYDTLTESKQLPWGVREEQTPGKYRLKEHNKQEAFAWNNGPQAIKPQLFKPQESLWRVKRDAQGKLQFEAAVDAEQPVAVIGARACDIAGMQVQDKTFLESQYVDQHYQQRREKLFIVGVSCGYSGQNCFCVSTNTGPAVTSGFDIGLTEIKGGFLTVSGSERGKAILDELNLVKAETAQQQQAEQHVERAVEMQQKKMPLQNSRKLKKILFDNLDHPQWDDVAERCLSCGNCTSVCPTCFCHHETENPAVDSSGSEHVREWDSCFTAGHSYIHGQVIRADTKSRYKQWLTHKLGSWWDQFDTSGCIGCGRCITWCPVGIDLTAEVAAIVGEDHDAEE